jgi:hypothetical protein
MLLVCLAAFAVVFLVLAVLAAVLRLITVLCPARDAALDLGLFAAISTSVASLAPGARVTRIEEES